jgi:hypothetical protein
MVQAVFDRLLVADEPPHPPSRILR